MKSWKEFPYWLKGGIISVSVLIGLVIILGTFSAIIQGGKCGFWDSPASFGLCYGNWWFLLNLPVFMISGKILFLLFPPTYSLVENTPSVAKNFLFYLMNFIGAALFWFLGGSLIGLIVSKVKKNKNKT